MMIIDYDDGCDDRSLPSLWTCSGFIVHTFIYNWEFKHLLGQGLKSHRRPLTILTLKLFNQVKINSFMKQTIERNGKKVPTCNENLERNNCSSK